MQRRLPRVPAPLVVAALLAMAAHAKRSPYGETAMTPFGGTGTFDDPLLIDLLAAADTWPNGVKAFEMRTRQLETKLHKVIEARPWDAALRAFMSECRARVWSHMDADDVISLTDLHKCLYHGVMGVMRNVCRQLTSEGGDRYNMAPEKQWNLYNYSSNTLYKAEVYHEGRGRLGMYPYQCCGGLSSGTIPERIMEQRAVPCQVFDSYAQRDQPKEVNEDLFIGVTLALEEKAGRKIRHVCEVGVMSGGTGMGALSGGIDYMYHGHDLFFKASSGPIQALLIAFFGRRRVKFNPGHFFDTSPALRRDYMPCDFFYIDGGHDRYSAMLDFVALATPPAHMPTGALIMFDDWHVEGVALDIKDLEKAGYINDVKWYRGVPQAGKTFRHGMVGYNDALVDGKFREFEPGSSHRDKPWCTARYTGKLFDNTTATIGPKISPKVSVARSKGGKRKRKGGPQTSTTVPFFPFKQDVNL